MRKLAHEKRIDPETLEAIAESTRPFNPLDLPHGMKASEALPFHRALAENLGGVNWENTREHARALLRELTGREGKREVARDETLDVPAPTVIHTVGLSYAPEWGARSAIVAHDGKTFVAMATKSRGIALIDLATFEGKIFTTNFDGVTEVFPVQRDGNSYLLFRTPWAIEAMDVAQQNWGTSALKLETILEGRRPADLKVYDDAAGKPYAAVLGVTQDKVPTYRLRLVPLDPGSGWFAPGPRTIDLNLKRAWIHLGKLKSGTKIAAVDVDAHAVTFVDTKTARAGTPIPVEGKVSGTSRPAAFFDADAGPRALVAFDGGVALFDVKASKRLRTIATDTAQMTNITLHDGVAILSDDRQVALLDLATERVLQRIPAPEIQSVPVVVPINGKPTLVWGDRKGGLTLADFQSGVPLISQKLGAAGVSSLLPVTREGATQVIGLSYHEAVQFIQLVKPR